MWPRFWMTRGPASRYFAGSRSCHTFACSMTWSSTEMIRGKSSITLRPPSAVGLRHRVLGSCSLRWRSAASCLHRTAGPDGPSGPGWRGRASGYGPTVEAGRDDGGRLPHVPALDGLRGLAVAIVVAFHLGHLQGGFLGVDLFFVLSGFLITSLLVAGARAEGRVNLGAFWARRARRLLPAMLVVV